MGINGIVTAACFLIGIDMALWSSSTPPNLLSAFKQVIPLFMGILSVAVAGNIITKSIEVKPINNSDPNGA